MAKDITWLGNSYSDVGFVDFPKTGGGTARFDDTSVTTATAPDVAQGKIFVAADGTITTGTASGGGGASNIVQGTFTYTAPTTSSTVLEIDLPYEGNGYPIAIGIYVADGPYNSSSDFYSHVQRYAVAHYQAIKANMTTAPAYTGGNQQNDGFSCVCRYKSSSSSATTYTQAASNAFVVCSQSAPSTSNYYQVVRMPSATKMKVLIAYTSVGFARGFTYSYYVIYSS